MLPRPPVLSDVGGHLSRSRATATPTQRKSKHIRVHQASPRASDAPGVRCDATLVAHAAATSSTSCSTVNPGDLAAFCAANRINISFAQEVRKDAAAAAVAGSSSSSLSTSTSEADFESLSALDPLQAAGSTVITVGRVPIVVPLVTVPQTAPTTTTTSSSSSGAKQVPGSTCDVQPEPSGMAGSSLSAVQGAAHEGGQQQHDKQKPGSKLSAASAEFYPRGYLAAAAVAAVAVAATNATSSSNSQPMAAAEVTSSSRQGMDSTAPVQQAPAMNAVSRQEPAAAGGGAGHALVTPPCPPEVVTPAPASATVLVTPPYTPVPAPSAAPAAAAAAASSVATMDSMPVGPYHPTAAPLAPQPMAHMVLQPVYYHPGGYYPVVPPHAMLPPPPAVAPVEAAYHQQQQQNMGPVLVPGPMQLHGQPMAMQQVAPLVPYSPMLPADSASLMGAARSSMASWNLDHDANDDAYSTTSSIAASSSGLPWASSSAASTSSSYAFRHSHHQQALFGRPLVHADDVVTVSALSSVKDAAGAVAKQLQKSGGGLLLALHRRPSDAPAAASLLAVKTLAVARFYINSRMAAMGAAGVSAAAALLGLNPLMQQQQAGGAEEGRSAAGQQQEREEVVFIPFSRPVGHQLVGAPLLPAGDGQRARYYPQQLQQQGQGGFGFLMGKVDSSRVPIALPAPVGMPACMQQQAASDASSSSSRAAPAPTTAAAAANGPLLLKAGGRTDANKLCAALVHHLVSQGRVAVQLAGAPACQVVLSALVAARQRLLRRFRCGLVAVASFATEDTSSELGRSTVFLRLDVMRCEAEGELLGPGAREYLPLAMA